MRIAFFGSDDFAVPSLRALAAAGHELGLVVTNPDRRRGRSSELLATPVKELALELGAPVVQPEGRPGDELATRLREAGLELGVVVAYGQFLTRAVRSAPGLGYSINLHGSLLPRWRGAAPVAAAIRAGDPVTGVSVQKVARRMDGGPVLARREEEVQPHDTRGALRERLSELGAELLVEAVAAISAGEARFEAQDEAQATYAGLLSKSDGLLDLSRPAVELERVVRACHPWPVAAVELGGARLQVLKAAVATGMTGAAPGTVVSVSDQGLWIETGHGALDLVEVRPTGKRAMSGAAYARGRRLATGEALR